MPRSATCHYNDSVGIKKAVFILNHTRQCYRCPLRPHTASDAIMDCARLLENLFEHKMRITALFKLRHRHAQCLYVNLCRTVICGYNLQRLPFLYDGNLIIVEIYHFIGEFNNRSGIRRKKRLVITNPYHKR